MQIFVMFLYKSDKKNIEFHKKSTEMNRIHYYLTLQLCFCAHNTYSKVSPKQIAHKVLISHTLHNAQPCLSAIAQITGSKCS